VSSTAAVNGVRAAAAAVAFLTRIPLGRVVALDERDVARGATFFPLVGAGIGALSGLVAEALAEPLPSLVAAAVALTVALVITGALHLDGLADTADALGARSRREALEIMRDARIGTFGTAALVLDLLAKAAALAFVVEHADAVTALAAAAALGRTAPLPLAATLRYARESGGPGSVLTGRASRAGTLVAIVVAGALAAGLLGWDGAVAAGAVAATAVLCGICWRVWLGGVTGDTLGASAELSEVVALVVLVGLS
jgi:adenosylcobinamide-GDP ribazoletransferase